jgi:hypothetical protein
MTPMNNFLAASSAQLRAFIDDICSVSSAQIASARIEPQYVAPTKIIDRLPPLSKEGLPSLPFLLEKSRLLAYLADLWVSHAPENIEQMSEVTEDENVRHFHRAALKVSQKSKTALKAAETAAHPSETSMRGWDGADVERAYSGQFEGQFEEPYRPQREVGMTALPPITTESHDQYHLDVSPIGGETTPSSHTSFGRRLPFPSRSTDDMNAIDEGAKRSVPSSRDGGKKGLFSRRKTREDYDLG